MDNQNLVNCLSCNNQISIYADHCIHCGYTRIGDERRYKKYLLLGGNKSNETSYDKMVEDQYYVLKALVFWVPLFFLLVMFGCMFLASPTPTLLFIAGMTVIIILGLIIKDKIRNSKTTELEE